MYREQFVELRPKETEKLENKQEKKQEVEESNKENVMVGMKRIK
jgi:hypothetical protein